MRKKALLALMLAATLLLSGCALIVKDEAVDNATPILTLGDVVVTKEQVLAEARNQMDETAYMYALYGQAYDTESKENIAAARNAAVTQLKTDMVLTAKAQELKLEEQLTEEDLADIETRAQSDLDSAVSYITSNQLADSELEGDALKEEALRILEEDYGITLDTYRESEKRSTIDDKLRDYAVQGVEVSQEEIEAEYATRVATDKEKYAEAAGSYAAAANNGYTVYYRPAGVRRVKQILIKFKEEDQTAISEATTAVSTARSKVSAAQAILDDDTADEDAKAQAQADLDAANAELDTAQTTLDTARETAFANIDADADDVLAQLADGADWDTLMAEKNEDPGMQSGETAEKGYAISADMTSFDAAFVEAGMGLEKVGDVTGKVRGDAYGYYIIRYVGDEPEGDVPLEEVQETIQSSLLSQKHTETYNSTVEQWISEAGVKENLGALND